MSISNRLKSKQQAIMSQSEGVVPGVEAPSVVAPRSASGGVLTAPGGMLVFRDEMLKQEAAVVGLEKELAQYREGIRTIKIDADNIAVSKWANRHSSSFQTPAFDRLKDEIAHAGGNIQPILVRPVGARYEVVFGHRRYTACKQLGLPVLAMIMVMSDEELFTLMDRENRERLDLTPYEQGEMWRKALDNGLFSSARQLAKHVGGSHGHVNQCIAIARLPQFVLDLFVNPTEIQVRWAKEINDQLQADPESLSERASRIKALGNSFGASKVFEMLTRDDRSPTKINAIHIKHEGKVIGKIQRGLDGDVSMTIKSGYLSDKAFADLEKSVGDLIGK